MQAIATISRAWLIGAALTLASGTAATAASISIYSFGAVSGDGAHPQAGLAADAGGALYGTTQGGGTSGNGAVFKLTPNGNGTYTESVLYSFSGGSDGSMPLAPVILDAAGALYGTTSSGGGCPIRSVGCGVVFKLTPNGNGTYTESVLHSFAGDPDADTPQYGALVFDAKGALYGTTWQGGDSSNCTPLGANGCGAAFKLTPKKRGGYKESVLYSFTGSPDGANPYAGLIITRKGALYGTTWQGGASSNCGGGCGTVFELAPATGGTYTENVLYSFSGAPNDGSHPYAGLVTGTGGVLYGTTYYGGPVDNNGSVFTLAPNGDGTYTESVLHGFTGGADGASPVGGLLSAGNSVFFGTTQFGGAANDGTVFEVNASGAETVLYSYSGSNGDGAHPTDAPISLSGVLYGTTFEGGASGSGAVFSLPQ